jgi:cytochrome c biogenesis protein CcdA
MVESGARTERDVRHAKELVMGFGVGIVLLVLGLILVTGAVDLPASVEEVIATTTVGWILILAGVLGIVLGLLAMRNRNTHTTVVEEQHRDV